MYRDPGHKILVKWPICSITSYGRCQEVRRLQLIHYSQGKGKAKTRQKAREWTGQTWRLVGWFGALLDEWGLKVIGWLFRGPPGSSSSEWRFHQLVVICPIIWPNKRAVSPAACTCLGLFCLFWWGRKYGVCSKKLRGWSRSGCLTITE